MLIKRLYLRNFRVYQDELDLELPPGLVGIYGPNGAGKSTLLEAVLFTLWGKARTTKEQIRSSGVGSDCVTEVEFEHEGHLYLVRRTLKGINSTVGVEAVCDGNLMSTGPRDVERYVESVLGMDDGAFRASVFTEQKQLAAFSNQSPAERRRLVLQLLGITPLDAARDAARKYARQLAADHDRLRAMLPDVEALRTYSADADAQAGASEAMAADEARVAARAQSRADAAEEAFRAVDLRRQEHGRLVAEGRAARKEMDLAHQAAARSRAQLADLDQMAGRLAELESAAEGLEDLEHRIAPLTAADAAARAAGRIRVGEPPPPADESRSAAVSAEAHRLARELAAAEALVQAAEAEMERTRRAAQSSAGLSGEAECPTCGQELGDAFETVQAHREAEQAEAQRALVGRRLHARDLGRRASDAAREAADLSQRLEAARQARTVWEQSEQRRMEAERARLDAWRLAESAGCLLAVDGSAPSTEALAGLLSKTKSELEAKRAAQHQVLALRGRLEGRPGLERALDAAQEQLDAAGSRVEVLREKVRAFGFRDEELEQATQAKAAAATVATQASASAQRAAIAAAEDRQRARGALERLTDGIAQHAKLSDLESESRHHSRAADLLGEFRNTVVASVGPRLAAQAADLFGELTDHEYEDIEVDPETYQLQISDGGRLYGLERFSGSEIDLANLALRVAISEHIHFQSGGSVGLLVLDEIFGPLDEDRKARMLLALERLRGRFRQILVVTHDGEIKEQLPGAIEVVKLVGRRATARVVGD